MLYEVITMLLNPVILEVLKRLRFPVSKAIAYTVFAAVLCFTPAVIFHTFSVYMPCVIAGVILLAILPTMITAMWRNNVAPEYRGKYVITSYSIHYTKLYELTACCAPIFCSKK